MSVNINLPNITATTPTGQIDQIRSYLYRFAEQLTWALNTLESAEKSGGLALETTSKTGTKETVKVSTFNELKSLIISNADIVTSYASAIKNIYDGSGTYVAQSDFGTYKEERKAILDVDTSTGATLLMEKVAEVEEEETRLYKGCIKIGDVTVSGDADTVYGVSVGQVIVENGTKTFVGSSRHTAHGIDFYDQHGNRKAYIETDALGDSKFFIEDAEITSTLLFGGYILDSAGGGIAFIWKE